MGIPIALWLGARRDGHGALAALAYPAVGVLVLTMLLAYSRGAIVAARARASASGCLRAAAPARRGVLVPGHVFGALAAIWAFGAVGPQRRRRAARAAHRRRHRARRADRCCWSSCCWRRGLAHDLAARPAQLAAPTRRAWGAGLLIALALAPFALAGALALSDRGLGGSVSEAWRDLTDPEANTPTNDPSRLTAIGSVRARYWRDAIDIFDARPVKGVGAGGYAQARLRFRDDDLDVLHAHGYFVQTAADLGIARPSAVARAARRVAGRCGDERQRPWRGARSAQGVSGARRPADDDRRRRRFAAHSLIDWTWFVPGTVVPALLLAGWVAGRGPGHRGRPLAPLRDAPARGVRNAAAGDRSGRGPRARDHRRVVDARARRPPSTASTTRSPRSPTAGPTRRASSRRRPAT